MYAGAQTRWKSKGKLRLCTAAPEKAVVQGEFNYLLNPQHPDFKLIKISTPKRFSLDMRMWKQDGPARRSRRAGGLSVSGKEAREFPVRSEDMPGQPLVKKVEQRN